MTRLKSSFVIAVALVFIGNAGLFAQSFKINGPKSWLGWTGKKVTGQHNGTISITNGSLTIGSKASGSFVIDMNTIVDEDLKDAGYNAKLVGHLKSDDFFSVAKFPTSNFEITKIEKYTDQWGATNKVFGKLTIKGVTNEINFPAKITINGNEITASAEFSIDRTKWGLKYGSGSFFDNLGDKAIDDQIKFNVNLVGSK